MHTDRQRDTVANRHDKTRLVSASVSQTTSQTRLISSLFYEHILGAEYRSLHCERPLLLRDKLCVRKAFFFFAGVQSVAHILFSLSHSLLASSLSGHTRMVHSFCLDKIIFSPSVCVWLDHAKVFHSLTGLD